MKKLIGSIGLILATTVSLLSAAGPAQATVTYSYAGGQQVLPAGTTAAGGASNVLVAEPFIDTANTEHSLMEISAKDTVTGNMMETGWIVSQAVNGDTQVHLFVGAWNGSTFLGYNATNTSWVDYAANPVNAGANLHAVAIDATFTNRIKNFFIQRDTTVACGSDLTGGWWVRYDNSWVGCVKNSAFTSAFTAANRVQWFGEVATTRASGKPCSDMGNAQFGSDYTAGGLDINDPTFFTSASLVGANPPTTTSLTLFEQNTASGAAANAFSIGSTGNRTFTLGGKEWTSTGTTPGNVGC